VTARYALSDQRDLVLVTQGIDSHFYDPGPGQPTNDSHSLLVMGGIDYQATGPWRYRLLLGIESRMFASKSFATHTAPVVSAEAIWTPTGLTTLTAQASRTIEDPAAEGTAGYTYTTAGLVVDHELRRNVLLQARTSYQTADYLQGGSTATSFSIGGGVVWLINRRVRLALDYTFTDQTSGSPSTFNATPNLTTLSNGGPFQRNIALLTLRLAL
jgi:hypothetical protein